MRRFFRPLVVAALLVALTPALVLAHPLGNFTINHFAAIRAGGGVVALDVVIDRAEIPTFQQRLALDTNRDGAIDAAEQENARGAACDSLATQLSLTADGVAVPLTPTAAGLSFPPGAGGLPTMRLVCEYSAAPPASTEPASLGFADNSFAERIGWREIVVEGDLGGVSNRLTAYPQDLLTQPLDQRSLNWTLAADAAAPATWTAPDAQPLADARAGTSDQAGSPAASVPGGIGSELSAIIDARDLSPAVVLGSLLIAIVLGAAHAVSPGHGKTIMAAYLVGTRGTARHAVALGLTVTVSHTLGVMLLALVTIVAAAAIPPERLYPILGVGSGGLVIVIGASLLVSRLRRILADRRHHQAHAHGHGHDHDHEHGHPHEPAPGSRLSWRGLFALGLSGGLMPSAAALILLLGSISAGRAAYGMLLVVGFGVGMAIVLGGVGLALVHAAKLVERLPARSLLSRSSGVVQLATAAIVIVLGVVLTGQALTQVL